MLTLNSAPYIVGVTGHMDLREEEVALLKPRLEILFRFLLWKKSPTQKENPWIPKLLEQLKAANPNEKNSFELIAYERALRGWPTLEKTPLVLMTSLAPGADTIAAEVALDLKEKDGLNIHVIAPLPMHHDLYLNASTFAKNSENPNVRNPKQALYESLLKRIGEDNTFCVRMAADEELSESQFREAVQRDRNFADSSRRHDRYRAAGEYIAEYSHLLLAIWDHHNDPEPDPKTAEGRKASAEGTAAIVQARRRHLQFGLLPGNDGLNCPHGGPVLHFYTHRVRNNEPKQEEPAARFLHCDAAEMQEEHGHDVRDPARLQFKELSLFNRIARNLDEYNQLEAPKENEIRDELSKLFVVKEKKSVVLDLAPVLQTEAKSLFERFHALFALRARVSDKHNGKLKSSQDLTLMCLFWLTLCAASLGHLYVEWHPQKHHEAKAETKAETKSNQAGAATPSDHSKTESKVAPAHEAGKPSEKDSHNAHAAAAAGKEVHSESHDHSEDEHKQDNRRPFLGLAACLCAFFAIILFTWRRSLHVSERAHDYRAIAEGIRVQAAWNLAGVGKSVPANYMQRQRGELDWIRSVIRAGSMPYDFWRGQLDRLSLKTQASAIRCVFENWVGGQLTYFDRSSQRNFHELHSWHKLGTIIALGGLIGTCMSVASAFYDSHEPFGWLKSRWWLGAILTALFLAITVFISRRRQHERERDWLQKHHKAPSPKRGSWGPLSSLKIQVFHLLEHGIITSHAHPTEYITPREDHWRMYLNGLSYVFPATALAFLAATVASLIAMLWTTSPGITTWTSVILGVYLVGGAMCIAWTEKQLDSEFAYQFGTMAPLFKAAYLRLKPLVAKLEEFAEADDQGQFISTRDEIRGVLYELGLEALDENAEWLMLHRARPLEPVMAG